MSTCGGYQRKTGRPCQLGKLSRQQLWRFMAHQCRSRTTVAAQTKNLDACLACQPEIRSLVIIVKYAHTAGCRKSQVRKVRPAPRPGSAQCHALAANSDVSSGLALQVHDRIALAEGGHFGRCRLPLASQLSVPGATHFTECAGVKCRHEPTHLLQPGHF